MKKKNYYWSERLDKLKGCDYSLRENSIKKKMNKSYELKYFKDSLTEKDFEINY